MKKSILIRSFLAILSISVSINCFPQSWSLTGNSGTNAPTNFLGTTDNKSLIFKTNNLQRVAITSSTYGGLEVGSSNLPGYLNIYGKDVVDTAIPFVISGNIRNQAWGNSAGLTMGRLIRLNQGPSASNGGINWYDLGIGRDTCFFITNHSVPPASGNGTIRKRMIVISPQDRVGINLAGTDAIGTGAVPTANFHTNGTVRHQNLPFGTGNVLVIDSAGNVYRGSGSPDTTAAKTAATMNTMLAELDGLKAEIAALKAAVKEMKSGFVRIATPNEMRLLQNSPNPFRKSTTIKYVLPGAFQQAMLNVRDINGVTVKTYNLAGSSSQLSITEGELVAGTYFYSLVVDGKTIETKKMVLAN